MDLDMYASTMELPYCYKSGSGNASALLRWNAERNRICRGIQREIENIEIEEIYSPFWELMIWCGREREKKKEKTANTIIMSFNVTISRGIYTKGTLCR